MNTGLKLFISLAIAGLATAVVVVAELGSPVPLGLLFAVATCATALLTGARGNSAVSTQDTSTRAASVAGSASATEQSTAAAPARVHSDAKREEGTVKWFNVSKGFGFIVRDNDEEIFVHFRSILGENRGKRSLRDGQRVAYTVVNSDKGPQAEDVEPLEAA